MVNFLVEKSLQKFLKDSSYRIDGWARLGPLLITVVASGRASGVKFNMASKPSDGLIEEKRPTRAQHGKMDVLNDDDDDDITDSQLPTTCNLLWMFKFN